MESIVKQVFTKEFRDEAVKLVLEQGLKQSRSCKAFEDIKQNVEQMGRFIEVRQAFND